MLLQRLRRSSPVTILGLVLMIATCCCFPTTEAFQPSVNKFAKGTADNAAVTSSGGRFKTALRVLPINECATASVMAAMGDLLAQMQSHKKEPKKLLVFDYKRTLQFMIKGFGEGFLWAAWYRWADHSCFAVTQVLTGGGDTMTSPFARKCVGTLVAVVMDLCLACPFIYAFWDIPFPALLRGTPVRKIPRLIHDKLGEMLLASVKVWTPVNIVIYNVPVQYRSYFMSVADVFWQAIVSSITSAPEGGPNAAVARQAQQSCSRATLKPQQP